MFTAISTLELDGEIDRVISLTSIGLGGSISHPNQSDKTISQPHMITQVNTHLLPPLHTHTHRAAGLCNQGMTCTFHGLSQFRLS